MKAVHARLISSEGAYLEAIVEIDGHHLTVMDEFGGSQLEPGTELELSLAPMYDDETWEAIFSGNPGQLCGLKSLGGWRYQVFGVVVAIQPVVVDCGVFHLEGPVESSDPRLVGSWLSATIVRLDAS